MQRNHREDERGRAERYPSMRCPARTPGTNQLGGSHGEQPDQGLAAGTTGCSVTTRSLMRSALTSASWFSLIANNLLGSGLCVLGHLHWSSASATAIRMSMHSGHVALLAARTLSTSAANTTPQTVHSPPRLLTWITLAAAPPARSSPSPPDHSPRGFEPPGPAIRRLKDAAASITFCNSDSVLFTCHLQPPRAGASDTRRGPCAPCASEP